LKKFFSFSVSLLSLLSLKATQWTLTTVWDSFCFKVLKRWRTFAFSLKRCSACFTHSFIATLSSDFSQRWAQFRNLMILTHMNNHNRYTQNTLHDLS
jgi:hypothetical protein